MTNQDLINYLNDVQAANNATIENLNMQITSFSNLIEGNIQANTGFQNNIDNLQNQINQITADNEMIPAIIALIPPDETP